MCQDSRETDMLQDVYFLSRLAEEKLIALLEDKSDKAIAMLADKSDKAIEVMKSKMKEDFWRCDKGIKRYLFHCEVRDWRERYRCRYLRHRLGLEEVTI
jgi:hypothetical protein